MKVIFGYIRIFLPLAAFILMGCGSEPPSESDSWAFCEAATCPSGAQEVESQSDCPQGDVHCYSVSDCGGTVWCWEPAFCDAEPVCPEYYEEVESCLIDDILCYEESMCGTTIYCAQAN